MLRREDKWVEQSYSRLGGGYRGGEAERLVAAIDDWAGWGGDGKAQHFPRKAQVLVIKLVVAVVTLSNDAVAFIIRKISVSICIKK
jgi:hypothetical protein